MDNWEENKRFWEEVNLTKASETQVGGFYKTLELSQEKVAIIDEEFFEYLNQFKWSATKISHVWYAIRMCPEGKFIYLHQELLGESPGYIIDHIDGDGLNNRISNLRFVTKSQNSFNSFYPKGISKYKGVWKRQDRKKPWVAEIRVENKKYYLGSFYTEKEAALAYNDAAITLVGNYAKLNEVNND